MQEIELITQELMNQLRGIEYGEVTITLKVHNAEIMTIDSARKVNIRQILRRKEGKIESN